MSDKFKYSDEQLKNLLDGIFDGSITSHAIPEDLYFAIADYLKAGLYKGFGGGLGAFGGKDLELLTELRENIYMFSGGKAYHQVNEISSLLLDASGAKRDIREFSALGAEMFETWNDAWGKTEYNTAIESAMQAIKWNEIQRNKDLLPILVYVTTEVACPICAPLNGLTARVDSPIWNKVYPINHFNCNCRVEQREDGTKLTENPGEVTGPVLKKMDDTFKINCGKEGYVFGSGHPYFDVPKADRDFAKTNFGLPIPETDKKDSVTVQQSKTAWTPLTNVDEIDATMRDKYKFYDGNIYSKSGQKLTKDELTKTNQIGDCLGNQIYGKLPNLYSRIESWAYPKGGVEYSTASNPIGFKPSVLAHYKPIDKMIEISSKPMVRDNPALYIGKTHNVGTDFATIFRHEFAHYSQNNLLTIPENKAWTAFYKEKGAFFFEKNVSKYAATDAGEAFAESFAAYTHPAYGQGGSVLTSEIEKMLESIIGRRTDL